MASPLFPQNAAKAASQGSTQDVPTAVSPKPLFQGEPAQKITPAAKPPGALFEQSVPKAVAPAPAPATPPVAPLAFKEPAKAAPANPLFAGVESKEQTLRRKLIAEITLEVDLNWTAEAILDYMNTGYSSFSKRFEKWGKQNNDMQSMYVSISSQWAQFEVTETLAKSYKWMSGKRGILDKIGGGSFEELEQHLSAVYSEKAVYESKLAIIKDKFEHLKKQTDLFVKALELLATDIPDYARITSFMLPFQTTLLMFPAEVELFERSFNQEMDQVEKLLHLTIPAFKSGRACAR